MIFISFLFKGLSCGSVTSPEHGYMTRNGLGIYGGILNDTLYGDIIQFDCSPGYELHGNKSVECLATGNWSTEEPTCNREC